MTTVVASKTMEIEDVGRQIKDWLVERSFETNAYEAEYGLLIKARRSSPLRAVLAADRALVIRISNDAGVTEVQVHQGSWLTNVASNAAWVALTGGGLLAVSGWSFVIQHQLVAYVRGILEVSGTEEEGSADVESPLQEVQL